MSLTDIEKAILAAGEKLRVEVQGSTLRVRKANLLKEVAQIDAAIAELEGSEPAEPAEPAEAVEPVKADEPAKPKVEASKPVAKKAPAKKVSDA